MADPITDEELVILRQSAAMAPLSQRDTERLLSALEDARRRLRRYESQPSARPPQA